MSLEHRVAVVTGATRRRSRNCRELARQGARVFVTGRSVPIINRSRNRSPRSAAITVEDGQVEAACDASPGRAIDILVNACRAAHEGLVENGESSCPGHLQQPALAVERDVGAASAPLTARASSRPAIVAQQRGLIVNIWSWAAQKHIGTSRMACFEAATDN